MSDPAPTEISPAPAPGGSGRRPGARWLDGVTGALLFASAIIATAAAVPSALRAAGAKLPEAEGQGAAPTIDLPKKPPEILGNPERFLGPEPEVDPEDAPMSPALGHAQLGHARGAAVLRDRPADGGKPIGEIKAGELVMILKTAGDWAQVWASGAEGVTMGWVKKSGIAVR